MMLELDPAVTRCLSRRGLIQLGLGCSLGLGGLNLGGLWRAQAAGADSSAPVFGRSLSVIRSCIVVFLYGGPSHLDTFDLKPEGPSEIRGDFKPIATTAPGVTVCEHLPLLARHMHQTAVIRSLYHAAHLHDSGSIHMLTGRPLEGPDRELFAPLPQQFPSYGSAVAALRRPVRVDGNAHEVAEVPFASLPFVFNNVVPTPCQGGGFLGTAYDPLLIDVEPNQKIYQVAALSPQEQLTSSRMQTRRALLSTLDGDRGASPMTAFHEKALQLLTSERLRKALDITQEAPAVRERYGIREPNASGPGYASHLRSQNFLLARRLVEAGVQFINIYDYKQQGQNWDAHANCCQQHKDHLLPPLDRGLSALIEDLTDRGLLDSTLIVVLGEFGRTPKINGGAGRDHWPECASTLLIGGGVAGGTYYGSSDRMGAFPATNPTTPGDLAATIFWRMGIDPATEIHDRSGRPFPVASGEPILRLFSADAA